MKIDCIKNLPLTSMIRAILAVLVLLNGGCAKKTENLGVFGKSRLTEVLGQDGVTPIPFNESFTMWTFGDTILDTWEKDVSTAETFSERIDIKSMLSNSLAFSGKLSSRRIEDTVFIFYKEKGKVVQFLKYKSYENPATVRLWPFDGIRLGDRVYIYYVMVNLYRTKKTPGFSIIGIGLAYWDVPEAWTVEKQVRFIRTGLLFPGNYPAFGVSVIKHGDYLYIPGHYTHDKVKTSIKIARVRPENIMKARAYHYLSAGGKWTTNIEKAGAFLGDVAGECSLSYNEHLRCYIILYCQKWTGKIIMVRFADFPELATAVKDTVYKPPPLRKENNTTRIMYYSAKEIFSHDKRLWAIYINPLEYQPYLIRVSLQGLPVPKMK